MTSQSAPNGSFRFIYTDFFNLKKNPTHFDNLRFFFKLSTCVESYVTATEKNETTSPGMKTTTLTSSEKPDPGRAESD